MENLVIDKEKIKEELIQKNLYTLQKDLTKQRRLRTFIMGILLFALLLTVVYGTLENPLEYTLSKIGNYFDYRWLFIVWSIVAGIAIQSAILALYRMENYHAKHLYKFTIASAAFLIITALIPSLSQIYPFWHFLHTLFAIIYALFVFMTLNPFVFFVSKNNPRLRLFLKIWLCVIWIGGAFTLILFGNSGIFEMWFFITIIIFLLYLSLILFEEKIVKMSVAFLKDEKNLDEAIEKIYINLDEK